MALIFLQGNRLGQEVIKDLLCSCRFHQWMAKTVKRSMNALDIHSQFMSCGNV